MSLDKAISHGKERRKPYRGCKAFDPTCRNHGSDTYMVKSRLHSRVKREVAADAQLREFEQDPPSDDKSDSEDEKMQVTTTILFYSANREQVESMHKRFKQALFKSGDEHYPVPLSAFVDEFYPLLSEFDIDCAGEVEDMSDVHPSSGFFSFLLYTSTPWSPKLALFGHMHTDFPDVMIAYIADDIEDKLFLKWDKDGVLQKELYGSDVKYFFEGYIPVKGGGEEYVSDWHTTAWHSIEEIRAYLDEALLFEVPHENDIGTLTQALLEKIREKTGDDAVNYWISSGEYCSVTPLDYPLFRKQ